MRSISSDLSANQEGVPEVEVLLATFNGELFLTEFLESLVLQEGVRIHLRVSDDGSTDRSLKIIEMYKNRFESCAISVGPLEGPSKNFFSLIEKATYGFVALADQDDVWLPRHLISAIKRLSQTPNLPSMTFSSVAEFVHERAGDSVWPDRFPGNDIRTVVTENLARGCTIVLNSKSVDLIKVNPPNNAIMHDWWILLLIYSSGIVTWSTKPEVRYRIHQNNAVGGSPIFRVRLARFFSNIQGHDWLVISQVEELLSNYSWSMSTQKRHELGSFLRDFRSPLLTGRLNLVLWRHRFRTSFLDELAVRFAFVSQKRSKRGPSSMGIFVYHRLRKVIAQFSFFLATFQLRIKTFFDYRITKRFDQFKVVKKIENLSGNGLAIVVLYPRAGILKSVHCLIDALISSKFSVLVVMNQSHLSREWLESLSSKPIEILTRPNLGRDFGAFKIGFQYSQKNGYLAQTDRLLFANDSVLYGPQSCNFVMSMLKHKLPWHAMFVNYQFHSHAQSFFQVFEKSIFEEDKFSEFWHRYYPSELRHHAINNGEVGLSATCQKLGFSPVSYVGAKTILENPEFKDFTTDEKFGIWSNHGSAYLNTSISTTENTKFLMHRQYLENNVTHHQGLIASRVLKAPLKLDIFQTGQVTLEGIETTLSALGFHGQELQEVMNLMTIKGTHASRRGFNGLWGTYGYV
jgi:glycosyltransferase involved in cell wall biosynthesis